jgi:dTDP-glucose 4,6-dehydratase
MTILITGAAGFIGSNFVRCILQNTDHSVVSFDALTYAGNIQNLADCPPNRHVFVHGNICNAQQVASVLKNNNIRSIVHFAAESHVDRSIMNSDPFVQTNIVGTQCLLDAAMAHGIERFVHVSTDEVYGSLTPDDPPFTESHPMAPNSPYAASKASSDLLVRSTVKTFGFPAIITRCSNNYGPYQFPEKLIPLMIHNAQTQQKLPVYGNGLNIRDWVHVSDHCAAIAAVLSRGTIGEVYNIGGECELTNLQIVNHIIDICNANPQLIEFVKDRKGHDFRYAMDITKIKTELGFSPKISFLDGLNSTVAWYKANTQWLQQVVSGEYQTYYKEQYQ